MQSVILQINTPCRALCVYTWLCVHHYKCANVFLPSTHSHPCINPGFSVVPEHTGPSPPHHQRQSVAVTRSRTVTNDTPSQSNTYHHTGNTQAWK